MRRRKSTDSSHDGKAKRALVKIQKRYAKLRDYNAQLSAEVERLRDEIHQWRLASRASLLRIDKARIYGRVKQSEGLTMAEAAFADFARERGYTLYRAGWPDFLCLHESGRLVLIEVKSDTDSLRDSQIATFAALEAAGVRVRIWRPGWDQPVPWRGFLTGTEARVTDGGGGQLLTAQGQTDGRRHGGSTDRSPAGAGRAAAD